MRQCLIAMATQRYRFGLFEFDPTTRELRRDGTLVRLQAQPAQLLALLLSESERTVSREELRVALWGEHTFVDFDRGLNFAVSQLRTALRDDATQPTYIRTIPKLGYQFIAPVKAISPAPAIPEMAAPAQKSNRKWPWLVALACLFVILSAIGAWFYQRHQAKTERPIVAILRFDNETGDPEMTRFSEALTDSVVQQLTASSVGHDEIIGNALILRTPRAQRDLRTIAASLHAQYIVLGQVQGCRTNLRVLAHLIRMPQQTHLWVVRRDRTAEEPLQLESDLAKQIASEFTTKISAASN